MKQELKFDNCFLKITLFFLIIKFIVVENLKKKFKTLQRMELKPPILLPQK